MAKTKFVRIATSGPTIDGRVIDPVQLNQAAKNYDRNTYAARINIEHIRGFTGDKPFGMYGDVLSLKTEDVTLNIAGKDEKRVALLAELDVSDDLIALNKSDQKVFSSIELTGNFGGKNEAYMVGMAVTDSPASLGTERLQFTTNAKALGNFVSSAIEFKLEAAEPAPGAAAQSEAVSLISGLTNLFAAFTGAKPAEPAVVVPAVVTQPAAGQFDMAAFATTIQTGFGTLGTAIAKSSEANAAAVKTVSDDLAEFKKQVEKTPAGTYTQRPTAAGGSGAVLSDF